MKIYKQLVFYVYLISFIHTQISIESVPHSILMNKYSNVPLIETEKINLNQIIEQDNIDKINGKPFKFAHSFNVDINFFDRAVVDLLDNGDKIYRLKVHSEGALSLSLIFDNFHLSKNCELFFYSPNYETQIGAFTDQNNKYYNRFSTTPITGEDIIIEFYEPFDVEGDSFLNISNIIHGYKAFNNRGYDDSQSCHNNVNCNNAQSWTDEKNSVIMTITDGGTRLCSGTMINNVNQDYELYFLTSQNCLGGHEDWIFMFNYESPSCENQDGITTNTVSGATLLSNNSFSDYALLRLEETPPSSYNVYFSGWDAREIIPSNCVSIHHPVGDIKKISFHQGTAISDGWFFDDDSHWRIREWNSGITEPGSYGAPLFNENYHIVGQLHGGESDCSDRVNDYFGKFSKSWELGLNNWLDPNETNTLVLDGISENDIPDPNLSYNISNENILIMDDEIENSTISIYNSGEDDSVLDYKLYNSPFSSTGSYPDLANYYWIDSKNNSNYSYYWDDIEEIGEIVEFQNNDSSSQPYQLGFEFPFYNQNYSSIIINPNGWIGFDIDNPEWDNISIPSEDAPLASIMAFWDDLNPENLDSSSDMSGEVLFYTDNSKCIVWYNNVVHWGADEPYNFQIIIYKSGLIDINYNSMDGELSSATIGIQNQYGQVGHQVTFNANYIEDSLRLSFKQADEWLSIDTQNYLENSLISNDSFIHNMQIDGYQIDDGYYESYLHLESNATGTIILPINIQVGYQSFIGDVNIDGQINVQDIVLLINILIGDIPPNNEADINQDNQINVLDAVLLVSIILES